MLDKYFILLIITIFLISGCSTSETEGVTDSDIENQVESDESNEDSTTEQNLESENAGIVLSSPEDYIRIENKDELNTESDLSISVWVKSSTNDRGAFVSKIDSDNNQRSFVLMLVQPPGNAWFWLSEDGGNENRAYLTSDKNMKTDEWQHIVAVFDKDKKSMNIYLNGKINNGDLNGNVPESIFESNVDLIIGQEENGKEPFIGELAEIRLYEKALNNNEIEELYNSRFDAMNVLKEDLMGYWPLDGDLKDYSGNGNDGVMNGQIEFN